MASPVKRKPWKSHGSDQVIASEKVQDGRPLLKVHFSTKRDHFVKRRTQSNLMTKDAMDECRDHRPTKDPTYDVFRMECHTGVQAVPTKRDNIAQTPFFRGVNMSVQASPPQVDARIQPGKEDPKMDPKMKKFFDRALPRMMHHLTQNAEIQVFVDDYNELTEDDAFVGTREDNFLREQGNFTHAHTKGKKVTCIDWRAGSSRQGSTLAISAIESYGLAERVEQMRKVKSSVALVWTPLADPMHPKFVLECPNEILTIKFNPSRPNFVIAGCMNGQVVMWNLDRANEAVTKTTTRVRAPQQHHNEDPTAIPPMQPPIKGHKLDQDGDAQVSRLQPTQISRVEGSHRRAVHDICWLPDNLECGFDGKLFRTEEPHNQFVTVSEDGFMCIWDLRPDHLPQDKLRKMKYTVNKDAKGGGMDDKPWVPLFRFPLTKPDGSGELLGLRIHMEGLATKKDHEGRTTSVPSYAMCCTSIEGEFCACNWGSKEESKSTQQFTEDGQKKENRIVRSLSTAHFGPAVSLHRHPQLPDYYLTVGDWGFKIWKIGLATPVIASPMAEYQVLCGRWSPTRASVVFVGTSEGYIEVWDLLDRSHEPVSRVGIGDAITTLEFKPLSERKQGTNAPPGQLIALGTKQGSFHLFELPKILVKGHTHELRNMRQLLDREVRRVAYFRWRWKERQREMDRQIQDRSENPGAAKKDGGEDEGGEGGETEYMYDEEATQAFLAKVEALGGETANM